MGNLAYSSLEKFRVFVERQDQEVWAIKRDYLWSSANLFRRAVREAWSVEQCLRETYLVFEENVHSHRKTRPRSPRVRTWLEEAKAEITSQKEHWEMQRLAALQKAAPGDVAEECMKLIQAAEDPRAVAACLRPALERLLAKPRRREPMAV